MRRMLIALMAAVAAVMGFAASGDTYVWTGAEDGRWMNAANWTHNGVPASVPPGIPMSEVTTSDKKVDTISDAGLARKGEKVEFGACATANTTIDFDGLYSIGQITVKAGAPAYTFGKSATQILPIESGSSGKLILESGLENMPVMAAVFSVGAATSTRDSTVYIENNADKEFAIGDIGDMRSTTADTWGFSYVYLQGSGTGSYRLTGAHVFDQGKIQTGLRITVSVPKVTVASTIENMSILELRSGNGNVEILKGAILAFGGLNGNQIYGGVDGCSITGEGILRFKGGPTATGTNRARIYAAKNCTLEIAATFEMAGASSGVEPDVNMYGNNTAVDQNGTVYFSGENRALGCLAFIDGNDRTCKVGPDGLPAGETVRFFANGTLATVWTNEATLARTFSVGNGFTACVGNAGTAPLTADVTVAPLDADSATAWLGAKAQTGPIALNAVFTEGQSVGLLIDGAETVSPSAETLAGVTAIRLKGGALDASAIPNWSPTVPVTFDTGAATLLVPDGETYLLSSLARSAGDTKGTLNLVCGTGRIRIDGASSGAAPAGVLVNGLAAEIREGGVIAPASPSVDIEISAKGDTVPDAPKQVVGITTEGTGGNDTLEAAATAVKGLVHAVSSDATVEIGADRRFAAEKVTLAGFAGNLNLGTDGDAGAFGAEGTEVRLQNDDLVTDLTVRAKLAKDLRVVVDGTVRAPVLAGGSVETNSVVVMAGELKVTGERTFAFDLLAAGTNRNVTTYADPATWPTVRFDGAKDVVVGQRGMHASYQFKTSGYSLDRSRGRIVVTNSLIRSDDVNRRTYASGGAWTDEYHSIVIGNRAAGWLEIQEGAVITNRIHIGAPLGGHRGLGFAWQTGGEVAALGDFTKNDSWGAGSGIGRDRSEGYYFLERGKLTGLGALTVGMSTGFLRQKGGSFSVVRHPADTGNAGDVLLRVGDGNSANGHYWISGGTADVSAGGISMSGGYYLNSSSRASITADGTAFVDVGTKDIRMINTGNVPLEYPHHSFFNINDRAVVRAFGFHDYSRCGTNEDTKPENRHVFVNFNGGTFRTSADGKGIFHSFDPNRHLKDGAVASVVDHVVVYAGGMTVDTDGHSGNFIDVPLEGATGGGVTKVNFTPTQTVLDYDIAPLIEITGDGDGATAVADWDPATRTIREIRITSAGTGYTYANALVRIGPNSDLAHYRAEVTCDVAPNANTGAFTKAGEGSLTLEGTNTYGGATILAGGVLRIAGDRALPNGSALVPQGGILEVADGVTLPDAITVRLTNPDPDVRYDLILFEGDVPATLPTFTIEGSDDPNWRVVRVGKKLRVSYRRGLAIIVR